VATEVLVSKFPHAVLCLRDGVHKGLLSKVAPSSCRTELPAAQETDQSAIQPDPLNE
jgi:hypothetical protein